MRSFLILAALTSTTPALAQQDYSATITETLEEPENIPDVSRSERVASRAQPAAVWYAGCDEPRLAGLTPLFRGKPGYRREMDSDGDGVACEDWPGAFEDALKRQRERRKSR